MEFKGTKGEWKTLSKAQPNRGGLINDCKVVVRLEEKGADIFICDTFEGSYVGMNAKEQTANAQLIAAAPELLEALQNVLPMMGSYDDMHISDQKKYLAAEKAINKALNN